MDDGGRCLLDVISDPSALEYFLGSGNELKSGGQSDECTQVTTAQSKAELVSVTHQHFVTCGSNAYTYTALAQPIATLQSTGQTIPNHAPVPSSSSSLFHAPAPSPTTPSPILSASKSPMPPPSQSPSSMSSHRSPAQLPIHSMPCPSPSGYPVAQSPSAVQGIYQVRSPASSPLPTSFATTPLNKVQTATSMAPATINILQQQHPQQQTIHVPATLSNSTTVAPASAVLSGAPALQQLGGQIMQIIQTAPQSSTVRHHPSTMKPIQPKPQQILPKPAGGTSQTPYGKPVTLAQRTPVSLTPNQPSSLVIGQGQAVLPGANVTVSPQGTLLLNHISLGVGQNPIILPGNAGLPPNVQLLVRPQAPSNATTTSQSPASLTQASNINNAFLAALHVQSQAAQQAFLGQTKTLQGQGQTVVIPGQNLTATGQPQLSSANLRPNLISGARMVSQTQAPLVLQQIQGPITVIQALQGHNVGVSSTGITLSNPAASAGISQLGSVLQGPAFQSAVAPSLQQSIVLNNQHPSVIATTSPGMPALINHISDQSSSGQITQVTHLAAEQQSQQPSQHGISQQQVSMTPPVPPPKPHSVNLEELLKQTGIMPEDPPPTPPPPPVSSQMTMSVDPQSIATFAQMTTMPVVTSQCLPTVNGPQTVVVNQEHIPGQTAQSQLLAHLQHQPIVSSQLQATTPIQAQVKLSVGQDGCVIIQRPMFQTQGPTLAISPSQQTLGSQPVAIPLASFSTATTTTTTTTTTSNTTTVPAPTQPVQSVLLQRLSSAPHIQSPVTLQQHPQTLGQPPHQLSTSQASSATTSVIPVAVQGISVNLVQGMPVVTSASPPVTSTVLSFNAVSSPQSAAVSAPSVSTTANTILSSMLSQSHPMLAHTLSQDNRVVGDSVAVKPSSVSTGNGNFVSNGNQIIHQSPLLVQSLQTVTSSVGPLTTIPVSVANTSTASNSVTVPSVMPSITLSSDTSFVPPVSVTVASIQNSTVSSNVTFPRSCAPGVIFAGYPLPGLQPGQKVQTIQLTAQGQEALQKIQAQLRALAQKPRTQQHCQQIQQLQSEQQKILSQGKVIAVQQQPIAQQPLQMNQQQSPHLQPGQQPKYLQQKSVNFQAAASNSHHAGSIVASLSKTSGTSTSPVLPTPLLQGNTQMAALQVATTISTTQAILTSATSPVITTAAPTHLKIGNQLIAIAPQQPRASTHVKPLSPEQQQQILCQNQAKQALFLKLHHQKQQQPSQPQQQQVQSVTVHTTQESPVAVNQTAQTVNFTGGILQIKTLTPGVTHLKPVCPVAFSDQNRGVKRPASTPVSRTSLIQQQLNSDQNGVLSPNYKDPFASKEDACKRLLRYHVYNSRTPTVEDLQRADDLFETVSEQLLERAKSMFSKYRYLLLKESMKSNKTAEQVMLDRMFLQDETSSLEKDRQSVKEGKDLDLPPLPEHWLAVKTEREEIEPSETHLFEEKFSASKNVCENSESVDLVGTLPVVKIKQEPVSEVVMTYDDVSDDNSPSSADCHQQGEDSVVPHKNERIKNYDEWAEIQKELEMYPLESDEAGAGHIEFEPPDDGATALADFEPPVPKVSRTDDGISVIDSGSSLHHSSHSNQSGIPPLLHQHHEQSQAQELPHVKTHPMELIRNTEWGNALNVRSENSIEAVSPCISSEDPEDSEEPITSLLVRHYRPSADHGNNLELADIDELDGHYGNVVSDDDDGGDEDSRSRTITRSNHVGSCEESSCDMVGLFETTFKASSDLSDVPNGSCDRSEDDDLNAQVQSAINSILNLQQRIDDPCEAYVMRTVSGDNLVQVHLGANKNVEEEDEEEEEEEEEEEGEDEEGSAGGKNSGFTYNVVKHKDVEHEDDEEVEMDGMDYEAAGVAAEMDGFTNDGPSEIDVALDEAVKSILL